MFLLMNQSNSKSMIVALFDGAGFVLACLVHLLLSLNFDAKIQRMDESKL